MLYDDGMAKDYIIRDDKSGEILSKDEVIPTVLVINDQRWTFDFSKKSAADFHEYLKEYTALDVDPETVTVVDHKRTADVRIPTTSKRNKKQVQPGDVDTDLVSKEQKDAVREWAIENKVTAKNGNPVGRQGRLSAQLIEKYNTKHNTDWGVVPEQR